jgi:hypothetical protein
VPQKKKRKLGILNKQPLSSIKKNKAHNIKIKANASELYYMLLLFDFNDQVNDIRFRTSNKRSASNKHTGGDFEKGKMFIYINMHMFIYIYNKCLIILSSESSQYFFIGLIYEAFE